MRNLRLVIFLGKLNNLEIWGADIGNPYLESVTEEKLLLLLDLNLKIGKDTSLGLKSSGKRWPEALYDILKDMDFIPSRADPCVELWVISLLEIGHTFPLIAVDRNQLSYLCGRKRAVYRPCYSYC